MKLNPSEETIQVGPLAIRFLITAEDSNSSAAAFELLVPAHQRLPGPAHSHDHYEETIYGLEGALTFTVDGTAFSITAGQMLCIPRGAVHRFDNHDAKDAKTLCVITPAALSPDYFREIAEAIQAAAPGPPNPATMTAIMRRHGLTPAPPAP
jgi:quercetin dioxygenase-like cupin family protein